MTTDRDYAQDDRKGWLRTLQPRLRMVVQGSATTYPETPLQAARRRYGQDFGRTPWIKGPAYWTAERIHELTAANERLRRERR